MQEFFINYNQLRGSQTIYGMVLVCAEKYNLVIWYETKSVVCKHFRFMYVVEKIRTWNISLRDGHLHIDGVNHGRSTISSVCLCVWLGIGMSDHISIRILF